VPVLAVSPGRLAGACRLSPDGFVADCTIEKGRVAVIADADLLNAAPLGREAAHNLEALLAQIDAID
jgi:hypothetical protein